MKVPRLGAIRVALLLVIIVAVTLLVFRLQPGVGELDFLAYWSAARLLATGGNPYDAVSLKALVQETRADRDPGKGESFASWNPPWLLPLLLPLGALPFDLAVRLWILCNIALIGAAPVVTWKLTSESFDRRGALLVLAASLWSGQAAMTILTGQISSLVLMGVLLGAWWLHTNRDGLAGASLFLATIKPHITYFLLFSLALWVIRHRRWGVLRGMSAIAVVSMAVLQAVCPGWWSAYCSLLGTHYPMLLRYVTPTVGGLADALWGTHLFRFAGVLLLPLALPLLRLTNSRGWLTAMNLALLVSLPMAVYGFSADQIVLFPAVVQMVSWVWYGQLPPRWARAIGGGLVLVYIASFAILVAPSWQHGHWFVLIPLAWAGLYLLGLRHETKAAGELAGWA